MKVLMISTDLHVLKESNTRDRMRKLCQVTDELHVIVLGNNVDEFQDEKESKLYISGVASPFKVFDSIAAYRKGERILKNDDQATWLITTQEELGGIAGYLLTRRQHIQWEAQMHSDVASPYFRHHGVKNFFRYIVVRMLYQKASCIRVVSERVADNLRTIHSLKGVPMYTLPVFIDTEVYRGVRGNQKKIDAYYDTSFLIVSRLTKEKHVDLAIKALAKVVEEKPEAGLIIVGDGPERKSLERLVVSKKLETNVVFEGWQEDILRYFQVADCYLLTSWYEGYGRTIIEAMLAGAPILMTDVGIAGSVIKDEDNGLIVPVDDVSALTDAMLRFTNDKLIGMRLSDLASKSLANMPTLDEYLERVKQHWESCVKKR